MENPISNLSHSDSCQLRIAWATARPFIEREPLAHNAAWQPGHVIESGISRSRGMVTSVLQDAEMPAEVLL